MRLLTAHPCIQTTKSFASRTKSKTMKVKVPPSTVSLPHTSVLNYKPTYTQSRLPRCLIGRCHRRRTHQGLPQNLPNPPSRQIQAIPPSHPARLPSSQTYPLSHCSAEEERRRALFPPPPRLQHSQGSRPRALRSLP